MRRDGGSVFRARANTGDPHGPIEACPLMRTHARWYPWWPGAQHAPIKGRIHWCKTAYHQIDEPLATHGRTIHGGSVDQADDQAEARRDL